VSETLLLFVDVVAAYSNLLHPHKTRGQLQRLLETARTSTREPNVLLPEVRALRRRLGEETVAKITADYEAGRPTTQLMAEHSISKAGVLKLLKDAGVTMRRRSMTEEQVRQARELREQGASIANVAAELQLARETIRRALIVGS
jgi:hypothetical protein